MNKILMCLIILSFHLPLLSAQHWESVGGGLNIILNPTVYTFYNYNNLLYVGGSFDSIAGGTIFSEGLGIWDNQNWTSGASDFYIGPPKCFTEFQGSLYMGGGFKRINGNKYCNKIARLDSTGYWSPLGSGVTSNGEVKCMAVYNGDLYVGGGFNEVDSFITANSIARWDGTSWYAIGSGIQGSFGVNDMTVFQNQLYVGGFFSSANGVQTLGIGRWNGTNWDSLGTGLNGPVNTLFADTINSRLYVGGYFTIAGGISTPTGVAYWDGSNWFPVGTNPYIPSWDLIIYDGKLYNTSTTNQAVNSLGDTIKYLAWYDGVNWNPVPGGLSSTGNCFGVYQNELYVGGYFQYAGDSLVNGIAKWMPGSLGVEEVKSETLKMKVTPNPAGDEVILELLLSEPTRLKVFVTDIEGKKVYSEHFATNGKHIVNITGFVSGVYFFSVFKNEKLVASEKVVISK